MHFAERIIEQPPLSSGGMLVLDFPTGGASPNTAKTLCEIESRFAVVLSPFDYIGDCNPLQQQRLWVNFACSSARS